MTACWQLLLFYFQLIYFLLFFNANNTKNNFIRNRLSYLVFHLFIRSNLRISFIHIHFFAKVGINLLRLALPSIGLAATFRFKRNRPDSLRQPSASSETFLQLNQSFLLLASYSCCQRPRLWVFGGLREHSLSHSDKVNAGAKPPKCTSAANVP